MTTVPSAVRRQAAEAEKLMEQMEAEKRKQDTLVADAVKTASEQQEPEQQTAAEAASQVPLDDTPPAEGEAQTPPAPLQNDELDKLRNELRVSQSRLSTLQGKYNAEISRVGEENSGLKKRMEEIENRFQQQDEDKNPPHTKYLSEKEKSEFDGTVLDTQAKIAKGVAESVADKKLKSLTAELAEIKRLISVRDSLPKPSTQATEQMPSPATSQFFATVETKHPGFCHTNATSQQWFAFLNQPDSASNGTYRMAASVAVKNENVEEISRIYNEFLRAAGGTAESRKAKVASQVKPSRVSGEAPRAPQAQYINASTMEKFQQDYARGKYKGAEGEAKAKKILAEFDKAGAEGRVLMGR